MTAVYRNQGIDLQYPENWVLSEVEALPGSPQLLIEAPDGSMLTLVFRERGTDCKLLADELVEIMAQEFPDLESIAAEEELQGVTGAGFDCEVFYLDLLVSAWVRVFAGRNQVIGVLAQAESRDFARHHLVFKAIVASALR
ncbi:MAG TPA: hypothetical protein PKD54_11385 [Pirellulaceae bacterium]|nr:hypothetical protein [Pirellulaceae bacterium]